MSNPRFDLTHDTNNDHEGYVRLMERPERGKHRRAIVLLFLLIGGLAILSSGGVLAWQLTSHTNTSDVPSSTPGGSGSAGKLPAGCTSAREPLDLIMRQTAQGLHLTVAQVQGRVLAGQTIAQVATAQGLTATQLHDVEIQALHYANNRWLSMGCITQQDVQDNMRRDIGSAAFMDEEFTDWFKG